MATEDILIRYRADVSQLEADINKVIDSQEELTAATKQQTAEITKAANAQEYDIKRRNQLLAQEEKNLKQLKAAQKEAFDPDQIEKFNKKIEESNKRIGLLSGNAKKQASGISELGNVASGVFRNIAGLAAAAFSVDAILNFGKQAIDTFARLETAQITFETLVGNAELATKLFNELKDFSIKTPFSAEDVQAAAKTLIQFGVSTNDVLDTVKILGDVSAGTGKNIQELSVIFGQIASTGRLTGQDLLQLINAGFNPLQVIAEKTGKSVSTLKKEMEKGNITFEQVQEAFKIATSEGGKFFDLTNKLAGTTAGQLSTLQDQSDQLAASIGSKLAPAWLQLKNSFLEAVDALLKNDVQEQQEKVQKGIQRLADAVQGEVEGQRQFYEESLNLSPAEAQIKAIEGVRKRINKEIGLYIGASTEEGSRRSADLKYELQALDDLEKAYAGAAEEAKKQAEKRAQAEADAAAELADKRIKEAQKVAAEVKKILDDLDKEIRKVQQDLAKQRIEILPEDSQKQQEEKIMALADLNEQAIEEEIAGKIKLVQEDNKLSEKQKQEIIKKYNELKQARLNLAQFNEQNELNIISAEQVKRIEEAAKQLDDLNIEQALTIQSDKVETANEAVAKSFEDLSQAVSKADFENAKKAAEERTAALNQEIQNEQNLNVTRIENARDAELAKVKDGEAAAAEREAINKKFDNQILEATKKTNDQIAENNKQLNDNIITEGKRATEERIAQTFEVLQATQTVLNEINGLFKQASDQRISEIEDLRTAQLESLDQQLADNELLYEQRKITDEQLAEQQKLLAEERVKVEAEAQKKIRAEKKKQATLDKAAALFDIAINTSVAVSKVLAQTGVVSPALIPLIIAAGALQAAAVIAQPVPYRKGSKDTGAKGHLARVGEEGEELVFMPSNSKVLPARQTKKYSDIIDAMYDNKLDNFIYKNYITPALLAQQNAKENQRSKNFAENIANSITYNQSGLTASDLEAQRKRGQYIRNVDEIASAIAKNLPTFDPYRR